MNPEWEDLEGLTAEIRRVIEGNRQFLERVNDEEFPDEEGDEPELEEFEEL